MFYRHRSQDDQVNKLEKKGPRGAIVAFLLLKMFNHVPKSAQFIFIKRTPNMMKTNHHFKLKKLLRPITHAMVEMCKRCQLVFHQLRLIQALQQC